MSTDYKHDCWDWTGSFFCFFSGRMFVQDVFNKRFFIGKECVLNCHNKKLGEKKGCETVEEVTEVPNKKNNYCTSGLHLNTWRHLDPFGPWDPGPARTFPVILYKSERPLFSFPLIKMINKEKKHDSVISASLISCSPSGSLPRSHGPRPVSNRVWTLCPFFFLSLFSTSKRGREGEQLKNKKPTEFEV